MRQIDILIEGYIASSKIRIVVDGKYYSNKVDVKEVESFMRMLNDCEANKGILITQKGFSKAALNRAYYETIDLELDILNFKELKQFQGHTAIPYKENCGAILGAPFGWIIDNKGFPGTIATLYRRGLVLDSAIKSHEWMYINFEIKTEIINSIEDLCKYQKEATLEFSSKAKFSYRNTIKRDDAKTRLRFIEIPTYATTEYTGFIEFESFIFCVVMFSPLETEKRNLSKLESILEKVMPLKIINNKKGNS